MVFECRFSTDAFRILSDRLPELPNLRGIGFRGALQPAQHDIAYLLNRLADCKLLSFRMPISSWKNVGIQEAFAQFLEKQAGTALYFQYMIIDLFLLRLFRIALFACSCNPQKPTVV